MEHGELAVKKWEETLAVAETRVLRWVCGGKHIDRIRNKIWLTKVG